MIVDAHQHLWDPARHVYPWMVGPVAVLARPVGPGELREAAGGAGVTATVVVEAARTEAETRELLGVADAPDTLVAAVVGWVDLCAPDAGERLAALRGAAGGARLAGVRHNVEDEADPEWLLRPDVLRGLRAVAAAGLAFDLLVRTDQLPAARRACELVEGLPVVLDHGGKPPIAAGGWEPWSSEVERLARLEHVYCKLSGLVTEAHWASWRADGVERYAARLLELFGPARLMFGSDWPVCTLAASYREVLGLARAAVAGCSEEERDAVLGGTAAAFYGLATHLA